MHVGATLQLSDLGSIDVDQRQRELPGLDSLGPKSCRQPVDRDAYGGGQRRPGQPVISAGHLMNCDPGGKLIRAAKWVSSSLEDQERDVDLEFGRARLLRVARRMQRKSEREDPDGAGPTRRPACHASAAAAPAYRYAKLWPLRSKQSAQLLDCRGPRDIELGCRCRRPSAGHQIRLPHPRYGNPRLKCGSSYRAQVGRLDAAAGAVPQHQQPRRGTDGTRQLGVRRAARGFKGD